MEKFPEIFVCDYSFWCEDLETIEEELEDFEYKGPGWYHEECRTIVIFPHHEKAEHYTVHVWEDYNARELLIKSLKAFEFLIQMEVKRSAF